LTVFPFSFVDFNINAGIENISASQNVSVIMIQQFNVITITIKLVFWTMTAFGVLNF
jgi:hypothetical protein